MELRYLLAVDPSLRSSGWALFKINGGGLLGVGKITCLPTKYTLSDRYKDVQEKVVNLYSKIDLGASDIIVCESQTTMRDPKAAFKVEHVRSVFEVIGRQRYVSIPGRINPRSIHSELLGLTGKQAKRVEVKYSATKFAWGLFSEAFQSLGVVADESGLARHQDIVDAVLLGHLGCLWINRAKLVGAELSEVFLDNRHVGSQRRAWSNLISKN